MGETSFERRANRVRFNVELRRAVRLERQRRGLTQRELADRAGVRAITVQKLEQGLHIPNAHTMFLIEAALGVPHLLDDETRRVLAPGWIGRDGRWHRKRA